MNTTFSKRIIICSIVIVLGSGFSSILGPPRAMAATIPQPISPLAQVVCQAGYTTYSTSNVAQTQTITHAGHYTNGTGVSMTVSITEAVQNTIKSTVTASVSGTFSAAAVIAKLSSTVGMTLASEGVTTNSSSKTVNVTVLPGKTVWEAEGTVKVTGNWSASYCPTGTSLVNSSGGATTFRTAMSTAAVQCDLAQTDAFAKVVKSTYC